MPTILCPRCETLFILSDQQARSARRCSCPRCRCVVDINQPPAPGNPFDFTDPPDALPAPHQPYEDPDRSGPNPDRCPKCGTRSMPEIRTIVAPLGWVLLSFGLALGLICVCLSIAACPFFLPGVFFTGVAFLALLIRQEQRVCLRCGLRTPI